MPPKASSPPSPPSRAAGAAGADAAGADAAGADAAGADAAGADAAGADAAGADAGFERRTPSRRLRADAERNRARLLDAARAAFASGQQPVTLDQVARDADVGIGTLYRHFPTREALVEALYRAELEDLCASAAELLTVQPPDLALRAWMDRFAGYVTAKREMADALRAVFASGAVTVPQIREQLAAAVQTILDAGVAAGTLRPDVRAEDIVATVVGMFAATSLAGGHEQLHRMLDLLMDAIRRPTQ